jgi:hypothetical protein
MLYLEVGLDGHGGSLVHMMRLRFQYILEIELQLLCT